MIKLVLPIILLSVTLFVSCLFMGACSALINGLFNVGIKPSKSDNNDFQNAIPALKF